MTRFSIILTTTCLIALPALAQADGRGAQMFERLDTNADGQVTTQEVTAQKTELFTRADTNADGQLDSAERAAAVTAEMQHRRAERESRAMERLDTDGDGNLSLAEFTATGPMFERVDADGNGIITTEEFEAARPHRRH